MKVLFDQACGAIKPMHATNNGPVVLLRDVENGTLHPFNNNLQAFKDAGVPYAFVEQERWDRDPYACLKEAMDWLDGEIAAV